EHSVRSCCQVIDHPGGSPIQGVGKRLLRDFPRNVGRTSATNGYWAWNSDTGDPNRLATPYEVTYYGFEVWELLRRVNTIEEPRQPVIAWAIESQMRFGCANIARQNDHRLRHARPSRAIITAASVGPEEPAGYGNGSLPETAHESRMFWIKRQAASTVS